MKKVNINILLAILALIFFTLSFTLSPIGILDDAWVTNCGLNIYKGKIIYKDFNVIITPLFYFLISIPLKIYPNIKSYIFLKSIIAFILLILHMHLLKHNTNNKCMFYLSGLLFFIYEFCCPNDYNSLIIIFLYIALLNFFKFIDYGKNKYIVLSSISCFLMCFTKQTIGIVLSFTIFICLVYILIKNKKIGKIMFFITPMLVLSIIFFIWLIINNNLFAFLDYCLLGLKNFSNSLSIIQFINADNKNIIYIILMGVAFLFNILFYKNNKNIKILILIIISIVNLIFIYPICNIAHFVVALIPLVTLTSISLCNLTKFDTIKDAKKILIGLYILVFLAIFALIYKNQIDTQKINMGYYSNCIVKNKDYNKIIPIIEYTQQNSNNNYYSIEDCYVAVELFNGKTVSGNLACYCYGNTGTTNYIDILKELENKENNYVYIYNNKSLYFWQTPIEARSYIINNYKYIESIKNFDIYKIK